MTGDLKVNLRLTADGKGFVGEVRVAKRELDKFAGGVRKGGSATASYTREVKRGAGATRGFSESMRVAHRRALQYFGVFAGAQGIAAATRGLVRHADAYTQVSNAVRIATDSAGEHARVSTELFDIAQRTRAPIASVADLYQKLSFSAADLGASSADMLQVIEGVGQALVINGTSAAQASGALLQLSQALGGGTVRAEEFNSILEGAQPILRAAAKHIDRAGGSVAKLRQLVIDGELSSREFFDAIKKSLPDLADQFSRAQATIAQGFVTVDNAMTEFIGRMDEASGASSALAGALQEFAAALDDVDTEALADSLDTVLTIVGWLAALLATRTAVALAAYGIKTAAATVATQGLAVAHTVARARIDAGRFALQHGAVAARRYGVAVKGASIALRGFSRLLSLAAGPAGWIALAAYSIYELSTSTRDASDAAREYARIQERIQSGASGAAGVSRSNTLENCFALSRARTLWWAAISAPLPPKISLPPVWSPCQWVFSTKRSGAS